jgi:hypothetical protein
MSSNPEKKIIINLALLLVGVTVIYFVLTKPSPKKNRQED